MHCAAPAIVTAVAARRCLSPAVAATTRLPSLRRQRRRESTALSPSRSHVQLLHGTEALVHSDWAGAFADASEQSLQKMRDDPFTWDSDVHWKDMLRLECRLTEAEISVKNSARQFSESVLMPIVQKGFRAEHFDKGLFKEMGAAGLLGPFIDGYGCAGASSTAYGIIAREVERVDTAYRSILSVQSSLVMYPINVFGTEEQKERFLPKLATGEVVGCSGLADLGHCPDSRGMMSTAVEKGDHYVLSGLKTWSINSPVADLCLVWARTDTDGKVRGFLVERGMEGLATPHIGGKFSLRASPTGMIHLDKVKVPVENVLQVTGMRGPFACLNIDRLGIAWGAWGAAEFCLEAARDYSLRRRQFGRPLAASQLVQMKMANAISEITIGLNAVLQATRMKEQGELHSNVISMMKRNSCAKALSIARECRDILGANGISDDFHIIRHVCNLEAVNTFEGPADVHGLILGRAMTCVAAIG
eukprot:TRINITY_DN19268_c0_g1_i1.p1 TRINITY_DN19268_c0_g1~~TRINITY_DN19268_c0_g1_i1.p1  ORF type:complete len:475 (+),score=53.69 TRINITY_DN19268_c0_g1_i1:78-1502(+)